MKKTFCDRCGVECNGQSVQRFTIFDVNRAIDVCEDCYSEFFRWLNNKELVPENVRMDFSSCDDCKYKNVGCGEDPCKNCSYNYVNKFCPYESDKSDVSDSDGLDEFIKDVKNDSDEGCGYCEYLNKKYWEYPCSECERCNNINKGCKKIDHFVKGDENNEN